MLRVTELISDLYAAGAAKHCGRKAVKVKTILVFRWLQD